ncbi:ATP-binding SpoIIE family protein phosphatase [Streptomyces nanshensis]|uniref:PPM-type phosphatase domain-containing protein n=1 Tax=Streptomyces nanshensis TaxID=518642 RepID=A0A1E7L4G7_9ACTN|nr:ATP-binding SpoIIE family protein phosphatase [Streptomyces nanshensis]OEV11048.1 hypothetical protein AN218_14745 [Streptomyces nanshensis]
MGGADDLRLRVLSGVEGLGEAEYLRLAVQQAMASVAGLGGFAHLREPEEQALRLEAASGLPAAVCRRWERLTDREETAPVQAAREGYAVWAPTWPTPADVEDIDSTGTADWEELGVLSAPLRVDGVLVGTLSVLTAAETSGEERAGVERLAEAAAWGLPGTEMPRLSGPPWWQEGSGTQRPLTDNTRIETPMGTWDWDLRTGKVQMDAASARALGHTGVAPPVWDQRLETWLSHIHEDDRSEVDREMRRALAEDDAAAGHVSAIVYRVRDAQERIGWVQTLAWIWRDEHGEVVRAFGTAADVTGQQNRLQFLALQQERHPDPMCALGPDDRVVWNNRAARHLTAVRGFGVVGEIPWLADPRLEEQGLPNMLRFARTAGGAAVQHEVEVEDPQGQMAAAYTVRAFSAGEHVVMQMVDVTAHRRAERTAVGRARQVERLRSEMAAALHAADVLDVVTRHALPLVDADGLLICRVSGRERDERTLLGEVGYPAGWGRALLDRDDPALQPRTLLDDETPRFVTSAEIGDLWPHLARLVQQSGHQAWALLPLDVGGGSAGRERVGHLAVSWSRERDPGPEERTLLVTVSGLLAQALARAWAYDREHARAQELRRSLQPTILPDVPAVATAARHRPGQADEPSAWYDAIPLPGGRVALISGAITGPGGLRTAVTMSRVRTAVATLAREDHPLRELMVLVNESVARQADDAGVMLLVAAYDATTGHLEMASAGHPPPALTAPGGGSRVCDLPIGPPLGGRTLPYEVSEQQVPAGTLMTVSTAGLAADGSNARHLDEAMARRLERAAAESRPDPGSGLETLADEVAADLDGRQRDAALLLARLDRVPDDHIVRWDLPLDAASASRGRDLAVEQMRRWHAAEEMEWSVQLAVSELLGNVVRHAHAGPLWVRMLYLNPVVVIQVHDGSRSSPHMQPLQLMDENGRGLLMIGKTAAAWGTHQTHDGKWIWVEFHPDGVPRGPAIGVDDGGAVDLDELERSLGVSEEE